MAYPRISAAIFTFLLIGSLSLLFIGAITWHSMQKPVFSPGTHVEQVEGKIVSIGNQQDFVLKLADGQRLHFLCSPGCHTDFAHIERHLYEHAATFVSYVRRTDNSLMALNVD